MAQDESNNNNHSNSPSSLLKTFLNARGAKEILLIVALLSFGMGCVLGVVPSTLANRYAFLEYGFDSGTNCSEYKVKPPACISGSNQAQIAASRANFASSLLTLWGNPLFVGWYSDTRGRRPIFLLALLLATFPAILFVCTAMVGFVNVPSIAFASLSDTIPEQFRVGAYGFVLAGFYGGHSLAPTLAVVLRDSMQLAWLSLLLISSSFLLAVCILPETLNREEEEDHDVVTDTIMSSSSEPITATDSVSSDTTTRWQSALLCTTMSITTILRPFREIGILGRNVWIRLLTVAYFLSAMVFAADTTLLVYYVQETFPIKPMDIAIMCLVAGTAGVVIQGVLLHPWVSLIGGEQTALLIAFLSGCCHNLLYGLARNKATLYGALILSQVTKTSFPLASSLASRGDLHFQGRIQGALFAVGGLGNAVGPVTMKFVQHQSAKSSTGVMFLYAAVLYAIGTLLVVVMFFTPQSNEELFSGSVQDDNGLEEPLLPASATDEYFNRESVDTSAAQQKPLGDETVEGGVTISLSTGQDKAEGNHNLSFSSE